LTERATVACKGPTETAISGGVFMSGYVAIDRSDRYRGGRTLGTLTHANRIRCMHFAIIEWVPNVQIRDVPPEVHRQLKAQAALAGQSLNDYLLARVRELAGTPTVPELIERMRRRGPYGGPSSAQVIRENRDRR